MEIRANHFLGPASARSRERIKAGKSKGPLDKYALDFTFGTQDPLKRDVAQGINAFRQSGARLYGGHH